MKFQIRPCTLEDAKAYTDHCIFHMQEKGIGGIYAHPFPFDHPWDKEEFYANLIKKWSLTPFSPNWEIAWIAIVEGRFVGHLSLRCGGIEAQKHRMRLGMGIESTFRSQGIGKSLLETAVRWAKDQDQISWLDLSVFSENVVAKRMYESIGFKETHTIKDALRIERKIIDDTQMVLQLIERNR